MQHDQLRFEARGRFQRLYGVAIRVFPLAAVQRGKFEQVRRRVVYPDGQRAEIMQGRDLDLSRIHRLHHAG